MRLERCSLSPKASRIRAREIEAALYNLSGMALFMRSRPAVERAGGAPARCAGVSALSLRHVRHTRIYPDFFFYFFCAPRRRCTANRETLHRAAARDRPFSVEIFSRNSHTTFIYMGRSSDVRSASDRYRMLH